MTLSGSVTNFRVTLDVGESTRHHAPTAKRIFPRRSMP